MSVQSSPSSTHGSEPDSHPSFVVRPARRAEVEAAAQVIAEAFGPVEPYLQWLFPRTENRARASLPLFRRPARHAYERNMLMVAIPASEDPYATAASAPAEVLGVALWGLQEDNARFSRRQRWTHHLASLPGQLTTLGEVLPILKLRTWRYFFESAIATKAHKPGAQNYRIPSKPDPN